MPGKTPYPSNRTGRLAQALTSFLLAAGGGAILWVGSGPLTGHPEPWDASDGSYSFWMLGIAAVAAAIYPRSMLPAILGIFVGQCLAIEYWLDTSDAAILPSWLSVPLFSGLPALGGALIGSYSGRFLGWSWGWIRPHRTEPPLSDAPSKGGRSRRKRGD